MNAISKAVHEILGIGSECSKCGQEILYGDSYSIKKEKEKLEISHNICPDRIQVKEFATHDHTLPSRSHH